MQSRFNNIRVISDTLRYRINCFLNPFEYYVDIRFSPDASTRKNREKTGI
jgi:hypothetical protein